MIYASTPSPARFGGYEFPYRAHKANPVLVGIRTLYPRGLTPQLAADAARYLTGGTHSFGVPTTPEQRAHARRVLERLARFA